MARSRHAACNRAACGSSSTAPPLLRRGQTEPGKLSTMVNEAAPLGKERKYARPERERRFLLSSRPDRPAKRIVQIADRYVTGTRLLLRQATETAASADATDLTVYKLTQKVPGADGGSGLVTTMYLNGAEYAALLRLPAAILHKTRFSIPPLGVDVFEGRLRGLILAEAEFDDDVSMAEFLTPAGAVAEVTHDQRLSGGRLATTTEHELAAVLGEYNTLNAPG